MPRCYAAVTYAFDADYVFRRRCFDTRAATRHADIALLPLPTLLPLPAIAYVMRLLSYAMLLLRYAAALRRYTLIRPRCCHAIAVTAAMLYATPPCC